MKWGTGLFECQPGFMLYCIMNQKPRKIFLKEWRREFALGHRPFMSHRDLLRKDSKTVPAMTDREYLRLLCST